MPEKYEQDLLKELEGLTNLQKLFQGFDSILCEFLKEYDTLDPDLVNILERVRYDVNLTLNGVILCDNKKVQGIIKQLDDVLDEVNILQAGFATKKGIPEEDCDEV